MRTIRLFLQAVYNSLSLGRFEENILKIVRLFLRALSGVLYLVQSEGSILRKTRFFLQTVYSALSLGRHKENIVKIAYLFSRALSSASSLVHGEGSSVRVNRLFLIYLIAIAGAELITALVNQVGGVIFYFFILVSLIYSSTVFRQSPSYQLFLVLVLAPVIRILNISVPLAQFSEIYWFLIVSIPLLGGILAIIRILDLSPADIGLTYGKIGFQGLIGLTGLGIGIVEYLILKPDPLILSLSWQEIIAPALILLIATGFVEELVFRGVMQNSAVQVLGAWGLVYIALLYSVLQIGHLSVLQCIFVLIIALYFGWVVRRTSSILGVSLAHGITNITLYLIFPFII